MCSEKVCKEDSFNILAKALILRQDLVKSSFESMLIQKLKFIGKKVKILNKMLEMILKVT